MTSLSPINSTAQTALQLFQSAAPAATNATTGLTAPTGSNLLNFGSSSLSAKASEAMTRIAQIVSESPSQTPDSESNILTRAGVQYEVSEALSRDELPERIRGDVPAAASYKMLTRVDVSDEEFEAIVFDNLKEQYTDDPSFQKALAEGTLTIQRAENVDGLELWETYHVQMFNESGGHIGEYWRGGAPTTSELYQSRRAEGLEQAVGSTNQLSYYAYWPGQDMEA
ncbi:hypothetical protein [Labrenzia sp. 011]|uniref:hypothetical protein n=1 Tax=Labrenzia sp. 011 TaxID=2171494 RepID=UPI000D519CBC|nr:hypothetical protein [Labrenzia sp. 011]PVB62107.1 hypothetical protein DCO57_09525 [Labrenzia sp. 011]